MSKDDYVLVGESAGSKLTKAQALGVEFAKKHFPGHEMLIATHEDGSNHAGNIHFHIVINSVRVQDVEARPYDARDCDAKAGFKHNCTKSFLKYLEQEVTKMCQEQGYHQVDFEYSGKRIANKEYQKFIVNRRSWTKK